MSGWTGTRADILATAMPRSRLHWPPRMVGAVQSPSRHDAAVDGDENKLRQGRSVVSESLLIVTNPNPRLRPSGSPTTRVVTTLWTASPSTSSAIIVMLTVLSQVQSHASSQHEISCVPSPHKADPDVSRCSTAKVPKPVMVTHSVLITGRLTH